MGGAKVHTSESGVGHVLAKTEEAALDTVKQYLSYLPQNWQQLPQLPSRALRRTSTCVRWSPKVSARPSICVAISAGLQMKAHSSEIHKGDGRANPVVGFARLDGKVVGLVANNPMFRAGCYSSIRPTRQPDSSSCAMPSTFR